MISGGTDNNLFELGQAGEFTVTNANAVGFAVEPVAGAYGGLPVVVIVDGDTANPVRVGDTGFKLQAGTFSSLRIIRKGLGRFNASDLYRVQLAREPYDLERLRLRQSSSGELLTESAGALVLFAFDSVSDWAKLTEENGGSHGPKVYFNPTADGVRVQSKPGDAFDLRGRSRVRITFRQSQPHPIPSLKLFAELYDSPTDLRDPSWPVDPHPLDNFYQPMPTVGAGSLNQLGYGAVYGGYDPPTGTSYGEIVLGAPGEQQTETRTATAQFSPFLRVYLLPAASHTWPNNTVGEPNVFRIVAVAY